MVSVRRNVPIREWEAGDTISGFALLTQKERRLDRNGRGYLDLQLADASGSISGKVWTDSPALDGEYESHDFVAFRGQVKLYRDQLQISLDECRRAAEGDRRYGFDEARLVPSTTEDIDDLWRRLEALYGEEISEPHLRRLARETMRAHGAALREHPAAKSVHHAYRGGLLEHTVSMAELAVAVARHYRELDRDLLLLGVLYHDLGKLLELGAMPRNDYTPVGRLVGHVVIGRDLLRERCAAIAGFPDELRLHLEHLILSHQGRLEFGSPVRPMTAEAIALHTLDDLDSKLAQVRQLPGSDSSFHYLRPMGRMIFRREDSSGPDAESEESPTQGTLL